MVIASINADGWQAVCAPVPQGPLVLTDVVVSRAGFTATGAATTFAETLKLTRRIRQPYPNQAVLTADKVALSNFIYVSDSVAGAVNNSALVSPKPVAKWVSLDRDVVGNSVSPELVAFHRDGVACVEFRATDGVATVTAVTSEAVVLGAAYDRQAVVGYRTVLDISSLTAGLITVHAKVYPRLGGAGSVLDSTETSARREFSARYYLKNAALAAAPMYVYVAAGGNDATGVVSAMAATAAASPCATIAGALVRINAVHGAVDGCVIRLTAGTYSWANPTGSRAQNVGAVLLTRDPAAARTDVILQWGATKMNPRLSGSLNAAIDTGCLRIGDITMNRVGDLTIVGDSSKRLEIQVAGALWNNNGRNFSMLELSDIWWFGVDYVGGRSSAMQPTTNGGHIFWRGCSGILGGANVDGYCMVGCDFREAGTTSPGALRIGNGSIRAFNRFSFATTSGSYVGLGSNDTSLVGVAIVQNLFEGLPNTSFTQMILSHDSSSFSTSHLICLQNTLTGFFDAGRSNILYNETPGSARTHTLHRVAGNIHVQLNTKHDVFISDGARTGGWSYLYGVGSEGEFTQFRDAGSGSFAQEYAGAGASIGTSSSVRNDPLFVDYRGGAAAAAGLGGGDYRLRAGSPAIGLLPAELLAFDLQGVRRTRRVAGAYEADMPQATTLATVPGRHALSSSPGRLLLISRVAAAPGRHAITDGGAALGVVQVARRAADGRVVRVDGDARTLWVRRD